MMEIKIEATKMPEPIKEQLVNWMWQTMHEKVMSAVLGLTALTELPVALRRLAGKEIRQRSQNDEISNGC